MEKDTLRKIYIKKRNSLSPLEKNELDNLIFENLINSRVYIDSKVIFTFVSLKSEIDTLKICKHALSKGKTLLIPKIIKGEKDMKSIIVKDLSLLEPLEYGILSLKDYEEYNNSIDLMITPLLALDNKGYRLGYGGGYYDRFMKKRTIYNSLGLMYSFQLINQLPRDPWDKKLDYYLTEDGLKRIED